MAGNDSHWQGSNKGTGASVDEGSTPKFSGDDMEFESFMFDSGELSTQSQSTAVATASAPVSAALDALPPMAGGVMPTSVPLPVEQPALEEDSSFAPVDQIDMPAFSFDASGPVDTAPVDPADMVIPTALQHADDITGEDVPPPFNLQSAEPEIPPFVPELAIKPLPVRPRSTGTLDMIPTGPLDRPATSVEPDSTLLQANEAEAADGWTDSSLSAVEDFSSVLLAMQAGSHFPLTTGSAAVLDAQPVHMAVEDSAAHYQPTSEPAQTVSTDTLPEQQEAEQQLEPQAMLEPAQDPSSAVEVLNDGAVIQVGQPEALESAAPYAEMQPEVAQVILPDEPAAIEEGQFKGSEFEFESFMFTSPVQSPKEPGLSNVTQKAAGESFAANVPATQQISEFQGPENTAALPFWLQTGVLSSSPDQPYEDSSPSPDAPASAVTSMTEMQSEASDVAMATAPPLESVPQEDYADLPPIDPFDFSLLEPVQEEERFGFNLQELDGMIPTDRVSTTVTTDLNALAEFLGTKPSDEMVMYKAAEPDVDIPAQEAPTEMAAQAEVEAEVIGKEKAKGTTILGQGTTVLRPQPEDDTRSASWTATVTTGLSAENRDQVELQGAHAEGEPVVELVQPQLGETEVEATSMALDNEPPVMHEIEINPFNYTELDLDDEETATEQLSSMATNSITSTGVLDTGSRQLTVPVLKPQPSLDADLSSGIPLDTGSFDDENETSYFSSAQPTKKVGGKATGWLSDSEGQGVGEQPAPGHSTNSAKAKSKTDGIAGGTKARVARSDTRERKRLDAETLDSVTGLSPDLTLQQQASAAQQVVSPATEPGNYASSGPLPAMEGFEALHELADRSPDDLSTQIALASAYAQNSEYDAALRTYRRVLKKRTMSPAMLEVIAEELSDIESEAGQMPRFHQVLGDLYMRQGRYKDAIDEYNKIG